MAAGPVGMLFTNASSQVYNISARCRCYWLSAGELAMSFQANGELVPSGGGDNIPLIREKMTIGKRDYVIAYELPADHIGKLEEVEEENIMSQSLLEKAGLQKPPREEPKRRSGFDPADFLLNDDE